MNILIVNENYTRGGLETNLYTQYEAMKNKNNFYFAMGRYKSNLTFDDSKIYEGFHFTPTVTINEFCEDVNRLVEIIKKEKIDVVHAHPFYSVFQAVFAAKLTNTPIAYTLHGVASFNFPYKVNDIILYQAMLESEIDKIFGVSNLCVSAVNNATNSNKTIFMPNAINIQKYSKNQVVYNKEWALISRLSPDKIKEIKQIIAMLNKLDINKICIYGDGNSKKDLQNYIESLGLTEKVKLLGHYDNLYKELNGKYNGVIGIGRVAIEAICMGYPILLIGYGKIAGVIDKEKYNIIKTNNFINKMLPDIDADVLNSQLKKVYSKESDEAELSELLREEFDAKKVYEKYENEINQIQKTSSYDIKRIFNDVSMIENKNEEFYSSRLVYNILKSHIESQCISINLKNNFVNFNNYFNLLDSNYQNHINLQNTINAEIANLRASINDNIQKQDIKINEIQDKINIKFLAYNTVYRAKNRKKLQR